MEKNTKEKDSFCSCSNCQPGLGLHNYHRFFFLRWFLALIILAMVFGIGFKIGEFKGTFDSEFSGGFGHHMYFERSYMPENHQSTQSLTPTPGSTKTTTTTTK